MENGGYRRIYPDFNSHARVGRDVGVYYVKIQIGYFNSHARVGRDAVHGGNTRRRVYFNSHARVGRDMG